MNLKPLLFSLLVFAASACRLSAQGLLPNVATLQVAGDIGLVSVGIGYDYGRQDRWETHLQTGYVPKFHSEKAAATFSLRQNLIPWSYGIGATRWARPDRVGEGPHIPWNRRALFSVEPAVFSFFLNSIFNDEFWVREPDKYNNGNYYRFSSKIRFHLGVGGRLSMNVPQSRKSDSAQAYRYSRLSLYYEFSTYDLAIVSAVPNKKITLGSILCLGVGLQYKFF